MAAGVSATFYDTWAFGLSGTYDGFSQRRVPAGAGHGTTSPYGVVTSLNYVNGPWVVGGYYQHAVGDNLTTDTLSTKGASTDLRQDTVDIGEFGASYLIDKNHDLLGAGRYTDVKLYASVYLYSFRSQGPPEPDTSQDGSVFIAGARFSFF